MLLLFAVRGLVMLKFCFAGSLEIDFDIRIAVVCFQWVRLCILELLLREHSLGWGLVVVARWRPAAFVAYLLWRDKIITFSWRSFARFLN